MNNRNKKNTIFRYFQSHVATNNIKFPDIVIDII